MATRKSKRTNAKRGARRGAKKQTVTGRLARKASAAKRSVARPASEVLRKVRQARAQGVAKVGVGAKQLGYAVIGLGHIAQAAVLPAFKHAKNAKIVALVSENAEKRSELGRRYGVKNLFSYDTLDECLALPEVDAVYIALPNDLHADYAVRAAKAGKHVLCEKPMDISEDACQRMIRACDNAGVKLMIAYRLHFEPANLHAIELIEQGKIGDPKLFSSDFSYQLNPDNIRSSAERGGGPLWDIGIYCINAARYLFRAEPLEVFAFASRGRGDPRFREVEEGACVAMRFPDDRLATFNVQYGAAATGTWRVIGTEGDICLDEAYEYVGGKEMTITIDDKSKTKKFDRVDQFAAELEYFADCVFDGAEPEPGGHEGWMDVRIILALHQSLKTGRPVKVEPLEIESRPEPEMKFEKPPVKSEPELVNVESPSS